jgi:VWFA-related protein
VRFDTVVADPAVARVAFSLDGRPAATDRRPPFGATLDLGERAAAHEVRAAAYDLSGRLLGEDSVAVNRELTPFRVAIREVSGDPSQGSVEVSGDVGVPTGDRLDRVELYVDERRVATVHDATFRVRVPTWGSGAEDYVRVVAYLAGGASREDVRLLGSRAAGERVNVDLMQLFAVVADDAGEPIEGLGKKDFELLRGGRPLTIDRVVPAGEIPLTLGLMLDSSQSMSGLLLDAKLASARFLRSVLRPRDRAFLVDFDERPRLAMDVTGDTDRIEQALDSLEVGGRTALFDSLVFALGRLEPERGRRAVVLLSDGLDDGSRFGPDRAVDLAAQQGIPVYVLSMAEPGSEGARVLDRLARSTGGRLYPARSLEAVRAAYREIDRELRTQYVLVHTLASPLTPGALRQMKVAVRGQGRHVRTLPLPPED